MKNKQFIYYIITLFIIALLMMFYRDGGSGVDDLLLSGFMVLVLMIPSALLGGLLTFLLGEKSNQDNIIKYGTAAMIICAIGYFYGISQKKEFQSYIENCLSYPDSYITIQDYSAADYIYKKCIENYEKPSDYDSSDY